MKLRAYWPAILALLLAAPASALDWEVTSLPPGFRFQLTNDPLGHIYAIGDSVLFTSTDDGATWTNRGAVARHLLSGSVHGAPGGQVFASDFAMGVFRSADGGGTWSASLVDEGCNGFAIHPGGTIFAGLTYSGSGMVHRSTDWGNTWTGVPLPESSNSFATECFAFGDQHEVYAGTIDGFYRSTDLGLTWSRSNNGLLGTNIRVLAVAPDHSIYIYTLHHAWLDGLYRSTDGGQSWVRLGGNAPYFTDLEAAPNGDLYGTSDDGVFRSTDHGLSWTSIGEDLAPFEQFESIVITSSGRLLVGGSQVYRSTGTVSSVETPGDRPAVFLLAQNHPNPFNGATSIAYSVQGPGDSAWVVIKVYDLLGREVATLVDGMRDVGAHTVAWDAGQEPSGVYFCRLWSAGEVVTRRMVHVK